MLASIVAMPPQPVQADTEPLFLLVLALVAFLVGWLIVPRRRRR
jgi:hypothetical protein